MEFFDVLEKRYSCRDFKDREVEQELIDKILEAGILSPTAVNFQPEKIYVCKSNDILEKLKTACKYTFNAKLVFVIAYDANISWKRKSSPFSVPSAISVMVPAAPNSIRKGSKTR